MSLNAAELNLTVESTFVNVCDALCLYCDGSPPTQNFVELPAVLSVCLTSSSSVSPEMPVIHCDLLLTNPSVLINDNLSSHSTLYISATDKALLNIHE